ncbi:MAG: endolytic transglycosylase MltG [Clostridia bacterium]|nr:endolytic transglycosylase MltG [Clostridia bacterium]
MSDEKSNRELERKLEANRQKKIESFKLNISDMDDDIADDVSFPEDDRRAEFLFEDDEPVIPSRLSDRQEQLSAREEEKRRKKALKEEKKRKKKKAKKNGCVFRVVWLVMVLIVGVLTAEFLLVGINDLLGRNRGEEEKIIIKVPKDANYEEIAKILSENGVISNEGYFKLYAKLTKDDDLIFAQGSYEMTNDMDYEAIINYLQSNANRVDTVELRFPEGMTILEIADKLAENDVCDKDEFLELCNSDKFDEDFSFLVDGRPKLDKTYYRLEGYLFPDTYEFYQGESAETTIYRFLNNFETRMYYTKQRLEVVEEKTEDEGPKIKYDEDGNVMYDEDGNVIYETDTNKRKTKKYEKLTLEEQAKKQGMTMDELIILASMIQSEAASTEDMYNVSSVFHNRLDTLKKDGYTDFGEYIRGMLDSDPTMYYPYKKNTLPDKKFESTYNTYKTAGLPAGAVCNPGMDAIKAALYPNDTNYYYFCHKAATDTEAAVAYYASTSSDHQYNLSRAGLS